MCVMRQRSCGAPRAAAALPATHELSATNTKLIGFAVTYSAHIEIMAPAWSAINCGPTQAARYTHGQRQTEGALARAHNARYVCRKMGARPFRMMMAVSISS